MTCGAYAIWAFDSNRCTATQTVAASASSLAAAGDVTGSNPSVFQTCHAFHYNQSLRCWRNKRRSSHRQYPLQFQFVIKICESHPKCGVRLWRTSSFDISACVVLTFVLPRIIIQMIALLVSSVLKYNSKSLCHHLYYWGLMKQSRCFWGSFPFSLSWPLRPPTFLFSHNLKFNAYSSIRLI